MRTVARPSSVDQCRPLHLAGRDPAVPLDVPCLLRAAGGDHPRTAPLEVEGHADGDDVRPPVGAQGGERAQAPLGPEVQQGLGKSSQPGRHEVTRAMLARPCVRRWIRWRHAALASLLDTVLDRTVVPGYTRLGPAVRRHLPTWPADPEPDALAGARALVTGASSGLGIATVEGLAALGAEVVLVVRDTDKAARVVQEVQERHPGALRRATL